jgi:hypothetical protein
MQEESSVLPAPKRTPWNKGKLIGAKPPLLAWHVWSIRTKLQIEKRTRERLRAIAYIEDGSPIAAFAPAEVGRRGTHLE